MKNAQPTIASILQKLLDKQTETLRKEFVTKGELKQELEAQEMRIDERAREYRDDLWNKIDTFMGRVTQVEENQLIGDYQTKERLLALEKRVAKLEKSHSRS